VLGAELPRISQFFGITIVMYYNDHAPAHFHALYAEYEITLVIGTLERLSGDLPRRALALVLEWSALHRAELLLDWDKARQGLPLDPIAPLE
jgi:hypothetical protein